jgi:hypothetical protein
MPSLKQYIILSSFVLLRARNVAAVKEQTCSDSSSGSGTCRADPGKDDNDDDRCQIFMAESTIPGAGVGIFSAVDRHPGDSIGRPDICIPVIDMNWHMGGESKFFNPLGDYFWTGHVMGMSSETDGEDIEALCPGLDCAVNCNIGLINTQKASPQYDLSSLHRSKDPGVGTFSPYHNGTSKVTKFIPAGT